MAELKNVAYQQLKPDDLTLNADLVIGDWKMEDHRCVALCHYLISNIGTFDHEKMLKYYESRKADLGKLGLFLTQELQNYMNCSRKRQSKVSTSQLQET